MTRVIKSLGTLVHICHFGSNNLRKLYVQENWFISHATKAYIISDTEVSVCTLMKKISCSDKGGGKH